MESLTSNEKNLLALIKAFNESVEANTVSILSVNIDTNVNGTIIMSITFREKDE